MLLYLVVCGFVVGFLMVGSLGEKMLGEGKWSVLNVQRCENDAEMPWRLTVKRHRVNRTHDAFDMDFELADDLDDLCAIRLEVCKVMDGGCKPWATMADDSMPQFVKKYAEDNVRAVLTLAGIENGDFPITKLVTKELTGSSHIARTKEGEYHMQNFMLDNEGLPKDGVYGKFGVHAYVVKGGRDVACCHGSLEYSPNDDYSATFG